MADDQDAKRAEMLKANPELEAEAKRMGDIPLHPVVSRIQQRFGMFNMIRNARNKNQVDINKIGDDQAQGS